MTAEEIKNSPPGPDIEDQNLWLKEIAYQLALRNEKPDKVFEMIQKELGKLTPFFEQAAAVLGGFGGGGRTQ